VLRFCKSAKAAKVNASKLLTFANLAARILELQGISAERASVTLDGLIADAEDIQQALSIFSPTTRRSPWRGVQATRSGTTLCFSMMAAGTPGVDGARETRAWMGCHAVFEESESGALMMPPNRDPSETCIKWAHLNESGSVMNSRRFMRAIGFVPTPCGGSAPLA